MTLSSAATLMFVFFKFGSLWYSVLGAQFLLTQFLFILHRFFLFFFLWEKLIEKYPGMYTGPAERRLSLASTTSAVLSAEQRSQFQSPRELRILSHNVRAPTAKAAELLRELSLNGVLRRERPSPIHLAIESN